MSAAKWAGVWVSAVMLLAVASSEAAQAVAGRILYVSGAVYIERGATRVPAVQGGVVESGDTIVTEDGGRVKWRMSDDSYFALRPDSRFKIDEYQEPAAGAGGGKAFYAMLAGGFRTITGLIGKGAQDNSAYQVTTPVATMGIRGTDHTHVFCQNSCGWAAKRAGKAIPDGLYIRVDTGAIIATNEGGRLEVKAGQYAYVKSKTTAPILLDEAPAVFLFWDADFSFDLRYIRDALRRIERFLDPGTIPSPN